MNDASAPFQVADVLYVHAQARPTWWARLVYAVKLLLGAPLLIKTEVLCEVSPGCTQGETGVDVGAIPWWPRRRQQGETHAASAAESHPTSSTILMTP
jgi:hypothetical protein